MWVTSSSGWLCLSFFCDDDDEVAKYVLSFVKKVFPDLYKCWDRECDFSHHHMIILYIVFDFSYM